MKIKRQLFSFISALLIVSIAGCAKQSNLNQIDNNNQQGTNESVAHLQKEQEATKEDVKEDQTEDMVSYEEDKTSNADLFIGCDKLKNQFHPFFTDRLSNQMIIKQTQVYLLSQDRSGKIVENSIKGENIPFYGVNYVYRGISDLSIEKDDMEQVNYTITIRRDITFSDHVSLTVDDIIFSLYVLCDPSYTGPYQLKKTSIIGLEDYLNGMATKISGIEKLDEKTIQIRTSGYDPNFVYQLILPICPLHYYGDETMYDYERDQFGFTKGDLEEIKKKKDCPMGAGPYCFVSYQNGVVQMKSNKEFYLGSPYITSIQFQEVEEKDKILKMEQGSYDILDIVGSFDRVKELRDGLLKNGSGQDIFDTRVLESAGYGYIGINAKNVKVGMDAGSIESRALRKAFATIFAVYRKEAIEEYYGDSAGILQHPLSRNSYVYSNELIDPIVECFSIDVNGNSLYSPDMELLDRYNHAKSAAIQYLKEAGYVYDSEKEVFIQAPLGGKLSFDLYINGLGIGDHPCYQIFVKAKEVFETLGFELNIYDQTEPNLLWEAIGNDQADIWCAAWQASIEPDPSYKYASENIKGFGGNSLNHYNIADGQLDDLMKDTKLIINVQEKIKQLNRCYEIIDDWAVEIPVYQRRNYVLWNSSKLSNVTITRYYTEYYHWSDEIYRIRLR